MPESETWTPGETQRAVARVFVTLERIEKKLDSRPSWDENSRQLAAQKRLDDTQDGAIKSLEDRLTRLVVVALGSLATSSGAVVVAFVTGG